MLAIGTPDDVAQKIEEMLKQSGGFGRLLLMAHNAASWQATQRSYEMFAQYVMPRFQNSDRREQSAQWAAANAGEFIGASVQGITQTVEKYKELLKT